jgi:hypothetical protein
MAGLGVFQNFSKGAAIDPNGFIPLYGTNPFHPLTGIINCAEGTGLGGYDFQTINQIIPEVTSGGGAMLLQAQGDITIAAGDDSFGSVILKTLDNKNTMYLQSGSGGLYGQFIDQCFLDVNDTFGQTSSITLNPSFFSLQATNGAANTQTTLNSDGNSVGVQAYNSTTNESAVISETPDDLRLTTDNGSGATILQEMHAGTFTVVTTHASGSTETYTQDDGFVSMQIVDPANGGAGYYFEGGDWQMNANNCNVYLQGDYAGLTDGNFRAVVKSKTGITSQFQFDAKGLTLFNQGAALILKNNGTTGRATLVGGTKLIGCPYVTAVSNIFITNRTPGGTVGSLYVSAVVPGTSFTVTSTSALDTSTINFLIIETI